MEVAKAAEMPPAPAADFELQEKMDQLDGLCQTVESTLVLVTMKLEESDELSEEEHAYLIAQTSDAVELLSREQPVLASEVRRLDSTKAETLRTEHRAFNKEKQALLKGLQLKLATKVPKKTAVTVSSSSSSSSDHLRNLHVKKADC